MEANPSQKDRKPLITRTCGLVCGLAWGFVVGFHLLIQFGFPMCTFCAKVPRMKGSLFALGGVVFLWTSTFLKFILQQKARESIHYSVYFVALNVVSMTLLNTSLGVLFDYGGTCVSSLGSITQLLMWPEWVSTVPVLVYLTIVVIDKPSFSSGDIAYMITMFLSLFTSFLIELTQKPFWGWTLLIVACSLYAIMFTLPAFLIHGVAAAAENDITSSIARQSFLLRAARRHQLSIWLVFGSLIFPVVYFLCIYRVLSPAKTIEVHHVFSVIIKGFFTTLITDVHMDLVIGADELALAEEKRAGKARRDFMK